MDVRPQIAEMDVFVLTSITETFSNAALEAMAMGCPVVMSRVGGASEMIVNGYNGFLYESGRPDALARTRAGLAADTETRRRLSGNARTIATTRFGFAYMVEKYEMLLGKSRAPAQPVASVT
jgi:glycosyltransferase involved in cell wall biosynthesis